MPEAFIAVSPVLMAAFGRGAAAFVSGARLRENPFDWGASGNPQGSHLNTAWNDGWLAKQAEMCAKGERSYAG
jgi:hypothetical protein